MNDARFDSPYHAPVLLDEVLGLLGGARRVLDGTLGGGGHALALLENGAHVIALDRDSDALASARRRLHEFEHSGRFVAEHGNFAETAVLIGLAGATFDGILLDLGVSSHQIDDEDRGFSFREGAPLDMRMDRDHPDEGSAVTAAAILNSADEWELTRIFRVYGDEPRAGRLAREIVRRRETRPFVTSDDLVGAIRAVFGPRSGRPEFARLFQAVRIAVNGELEALAQALPVLRDRLDPGGVLAVIAYHSGEDRLVKRAFQEWSLRCVCPPKQLVCTCRGRALGALTHRKPISAGADEVGRNPRARSAHLRGWRAGTPSAPVARQHRSTEQG